MPISLRVAWRTAARDRILYGVLVIFVGLALAWNYVTPIFEAPDEPDHLQYILFVTREARRPDLKLDVEQAGIESPQPPLYYLFAGYLLRLIGTPFPFDHPVKDPGFSVEPGEGEKRYFLPTSGSYDYVHFLRLLSTAFGIVTVLCSYLAAMILGATRSLARTAAAFTAFLPQFTFHSAAVSNDPLTSALAAVALVYLLGLLTSRISHPGGYIVFGALGGLAFLSKSHAVFLLPFGVLMLLLAAPERKRALVSIAAAIVGFMVISGPWLLYNFYYYGDPTAVNMQMQIVPELVFPKNPLSSIGALYFFFKFPRLIFMSFLGVFGWMSIFLPIWFYVAFGALWFCALAGMLYGIQRRKWDRVREGLILAPVLDVFVVTYVNLNFIAPHGRYLFPAIGAISLLFVFGIAEMPAVMRRLMLGIATIFLITANIYSLWFAWNTWYA